MTINPIGHSFLSPLISIQKECMRDHTVVNRFIGRMTAVVIPIFEFLQGVQFGAHAVGILAIQFVTTPVLIMEIIVKDDESIIEKTVPSALDLLTTILKATLCFVMVIGAPLLTLISPKFNIVIHEKLGLCLTSQSKEEESKRLETLLKRLKDQNSTAIEVKTGGPGFKKLVGMEVYKEEMRRTVIDPLLGTLSNHPTYEAFKSRFGSLEAERGMIFYGPTGCGKSEMARAIAQELRYPYVEISPQVLGSRYVDGSIERLRKVLEELKASLPAVIIINECETLFPNRLQLDGSSASGSQTAKFVGALLDGFDQLKEKGLVVIATTNLDLSKDGELEKLDPALLRHGRLGKHLQIPKPDDATREALLRHYTSLVAYSGSLAELVKEFKDRSIAEIQAFGVHLKDHLWKKAQGKQPDEVQGMQWGLCEVRELVKAQQQNPNLYYYT